MLQAVDSYFEYVRNRMLTVNPARKVVGVSDAMDWPSDVAIMNAFYLLTMGEKPITGKSFWSAAVPVVVHSLQWVWLIQGSDLTEGKVGRSRADRYRTNMTMRQELLKANYAWWGEKSNFSVIENTPSGPALQSTPMDPVENVWWTPLTFLNRLDRESGVIYGAASTQLTDMTETITA